MSRFCFTEYEYKRAVVRFYPPRLRRFGYWFGKVNAALLEVSRYSPIGHYLR